MLAPIRLEVNVNEDFYIHSYPGQNYCAKSIEMEILRETTTVMEADARQIIYGSGKKITEQIIIEPRKEIYRHSS